MGVFILAEASIGRGDPYVGGEVEFMGHVPGVIVMGAPAARRANSKRLSCFGVSTAAALTEKDHASVLTASAIFARNVHMPESNFAMIARRVTTQRPSAPNDCIA